MPTEIVKVQVPLVTSDQEVPWLIYDREQKHVTQVPDSIIPSHVKLAMGDDLKGYFQGSWSSVVGWGLGSRVEDQSW